MSKHYSYKAGFEKLYSSEEIVPVHRSGDSMRYEYCTIGTPYGIATYYCTSRIYADGETRPYGYILRFIYQGRLYEKRVVRKRLKGSGISRVVNKWVKEVVKENKK